ncbi:hypothetical protein [Streptomyces sp. NPDC046197]|uniref:hypothetical protein n=1 Tax=Streptomyces sp. NPDC046197 TaxID=3154337 RepID=UPI0033F33CD9
MRALPVRRITSSALGAALLVGTTGPVALAADSAPERPGRSHVTSAGKRLPGADALVVQVRKLNTFGSEAKPVTDLLNAVLEADHGQLPAAKARKLGDAAKRALLKVAARTPATPATTRAATAKSGTSERRAADPTSDALDALAKAIDTLVQSVTSGDVDQVLPSVAGLLTDAINLLTASLIDDPLPTPAAIDDPLPTPDESASTPLTEVPAVTLPEPVLPPAS